MPKGEITMARAKKSEIKAEEIQAQTEAQTEVIAEAQTEEIQAQTVKLERANRVAVQAVGTGYKADFYRTHKKLITLSSDETGWEADEEMNKSAQREDFRKYVIEHSEIYGILWNPADMRAEGNRRLAKYENDEDLKSDAVAMIESDIMALVEKCPYGYGSRGEMSIWSYLH